MAIKQEKLSMSGVAGRSIELDIGASDLVRLRYAVGTSDDVDSYVETEPE